VEAAVAFLNPRQSRFHLQQPDQPLKPDPLLYALSLMILTNVWRLQDLFPVLGILKLNLVATALTIALFAIDRDPARRLGTLKSPVLFCLLGILALAILGIPMSLWPRRTAMFVVRDFVPNLLLMVLLAAAVRGIRDLYWIARVILVGACIFSLFVHLRFEVTAAGRLDNLIYYDANDLALVLVCTIPFAIFFVVREGWRYRLFGLATLVLLIATIAQSGSRGGFLGLLAVLLYLLFGYRAIPTRVRLLASIGVFGLLAIVASEAYWDAIGTLRAPEQDYNWAGNSPEGRIEIWRRGLRYVAADPVLGVGMGNFPLAEGMLSEESRERAERGVGFKWSVAHNMFLEIAVELGLIAVTLFVASFVAAFRAVHRVRAGRPLQDPATLRRVAFACTLIASLVGFVVSGFFVSAEYFSYLYLLLGLSMAVAKVDADGRFRLGAWPGRRARIAARLSSRSGASLADRDPLSSLPRLHRRTRHSPKRG
jgi:O-antigen ligase